MEHPDHSSAHQEQAQAVASVSPLAAETPEEAAGQKTKLPSLLWGYPATYLLLGVNVFLYVLMLAGPAATLARQHEYGQIFTNVFDPDLIVRFGGSSSDAVLQGHQWWRLITANFVHVTFLHIAVNMWCLWNLGLFGEPLLGKPGLIAVYVLTGTSGMMLSLGWSLFSGHADIVAGASGAVFGIAGILIVLLSNRKLSLPWEELRSLRRSVVLFAVLNLAVGLAPRLLPALPGALLVPLHIDPNSLPNVDNTAHVGGFLSGLALGFPLFPRMTSGKSSYRARQGIVFGSAALLLCLLGYALAMSAKR